MADILLLTTCRDFLMGSLIDEASKKSGVDVNKIAELFSQTGHRVFIRRFEDVGSVDFYNGWYVLYASSEDPGLFYKDYIEDIVLRLQLAGAILVPRFELFRCHHNKCFMEGYRESLKDARLKTIRSYIYGSYESYQAAQHKPVNYPVVLKPSAGAGSNDVVIAADQSDLERKIKKLSRHVYWEYTPFKGYRLAEKAKNLFRRIIKKPVINYPPHEHKFVVQNFIPNLSGDYKVLVFSEKYYVLSRANRDNDFRASGSGKFTFPENADAISHILDFARLAFESFQHPICSLDICFDGTDCHLIEFQFLNFGPYTLQFSRWYFTFEQDKWIKVEGTSNLEEEYVRAMNLFFQKV